MNLTFEVKNGIATHSKGQNDSILPEDTSNLAVTLEGQIIRIADIIAYINHDMDDAFRAGIIKESDLPAKIVKVVGARHSKRIGTMVRDIIVESLREDDGRLHMSDVMLDVMNDLRAFLYENVYRFHMVHNEFEKAQKIIRELYHYFLENGLVRRVGTNWGHTGDHKEWASEEVAHRRVCDFIAGMTDRYALDLYEHLFLPKPWRSISI